MPNLAQCNGILSLTNCETCPSSFIMEKFYDKEVLIYDEEKII